MGILYNLMKHDQKDRLIAIYRQEVREQARMNERAIARLAREERYNRIAYGEDNKPVIFSRDTAIVNT